MDKNELMKIFGERLKELRESYGMTIKQVADTVHLTEATMSRYENGKMGAKRTTIQILASYFKVNPAWLMGYPSADKYLESELTEPKLKKIPILGYIAAGTPIFAEENIEGYEYVPDYSKADFCLRVKGDSMINARIYDGDMVYIRKQPEVETGEIAAVIIDGENATLKRFYKMGNQIILRPENPSHKEQIYTKTEFKEVTIVGKCIACKFWID